jgi:hypothetical protein
MDGSDRDVWNFPAGIEGNHDEPPNTIYPYWDLNREISEYEARMPFSRQQRSLNVYIYISATAY